MVKKSLLSTQMKHPGKAQLDMLSTTRDKLGDWDKVISGILVRFKGRNTASNYNVLLE